MNETTVQIDGMMSIFDDAVVEKQIKRRDGVVRVDANFLSGTATIVVRRDARRADWQWAQN